MGRPLRWLICGVLVLGLVGNWLIFGFVWLVAGKGWEKHKPPELCLANVFLVVVAVAQLAERQVVILDVAGSSPVGYPSSGARVSVHSEARARLQFVRFIQHSQYLSSKQHSFKQVYALLAQLAEQRTLNPQVLGSIPRERTTNVSPAISWWHVFCCELQRPVSNRATSDARRAGVLRRLYDC